MTPARFRAMWPILDQRTPLADLINEAEQELPALIRRAHAHLTRPGRFIVAPSVDVAGSGKVSDFVLLYDAPAVPKEPMWPPGGQIRMLLPLAEPPRRGVDEAVVIRLLAGERMKSTRAEKVEAMRRWIGAGRSEAEFCGIHEWKTGRYVDASAQQSA